MSLEHTPNQFSFWRKCNRCWASFFFFLQIASVVIECQFAINYNTQIFVTLNCLMVWPLMTVCLLKSTHIPLVLVTGNVMYIYSNTVQIQDTCILLEDFYFMQLYTSTSLHLRLHYISLTALVTSYFSNYNFSYPSCPVKTMYLQVWWFGMFLINWRIKCSC